MLTRRLSFSIKFANTNNHINCNVGDIAYVNNGNIETISSSNWDSSLGTPIGVVVIPSNFLPDGKARIMGLTRYVAYWDSRASYSVKNSPLKDYIKVPITDNQDENAILTTTDDGRLPSYPNNNFSDDVSYVDPPLKYHWAVTEKIPSPYYNGEYNEAYGQGALSDFNGLENTQTLISTGITYYKAAISAWQHTDGASNLQWYLPAIGELGFITVRINEIKNSLSILKKTSFYGDYHLSSSTEYDATQNWCNDYPGGGVWPYPKYQYQDVRPFAMLP